MIYQTIAHHLAEGIALKDCKTNIDYKLVFSNSDELFYAYSEDKFFYIFQYGVVSFFNMTNIEIETLTSKVVPFCINLSHDKISEDIEVEIASKVLDVKFDKIILPKLEKEMIRLVMLNVSQSVALNVYSDISELLLKETNEYTTYLEKNGKLNISGTKLKRFIGKTLNIKNKIAENLYIFDSHEITWENEQLNKLNLGLKWSFDLKDRYRVIHDRIDIIKDNLELFKDIMDHKESSKLEWIIIILILVEVVDLFILKFF